MLTTKCDFIKIIDMIIIFKISCSLFIKYEYNNGKLNTKTNRVIIKRVIYGFILLINLNFLINIDNLSNAINKFVMKLIEVSTFNQNKIEIFHC